MTIKQFRKECKRASKRPLKASLIDFIIFIATFLISELIGYFAEEDKRFIAIRLIILIIALLFISTRIKKHLKHNFYKCPKCNKGIIGDDNQHLVELTGSCYHCNEPIIEIKNKG
jgi:hypothetical protein